MADDVTLPGTGAVVATDDVSGVHYQRVKLDIGGDGAASAVTTSNPLPVTANAGTNLNTSALALETGGNLAAAVTALQIVDDWDESDRAKVNLIAGQAGITAGAGAVAANTPRVTHASDDPVVTALQIIDNMIAGNEAQVDVVTLPALPAGDNNIGNVDIVTVPADPFGANVDAAATAGSAGSIQSKLRLMTSQLDAIKTAVETLDNAIAGSEMQVDVATLPNVTIGAAIPAGTNNIGTVEARPSSKAPYTAEVTRVDYDGSNNPIYIGKAAPGTATSAASWAVQKITYSGSNPTTVQWADGNTTYDNVWDNRASLSYS